MGVIASDEHHQAASPVALMEDIQKGYDELKLRVKQLEADSGALEQENKALRVLLERAIDIRQRSHSELVIILTTLVSKLPVNDVGGIISKLVEHNNNVSQALAALTKGTAETELSRPEVLKNLDRTKRGLLAALKQAAAELAKLDPPLERELLESLSGDPELFFSPRMVRANRCFAKGQVPRERIIREFGEAALIFFKDMTTDAKLNPRPKSEEIVLAFRNDFEALCQQQATLLAGKRPHLEALCQRIQQSKAPTDQARAQKSAFQRLSFFAELLHYYEHQNTESPEVIFAQRLPALVEQLGVAGPQAPLDEKLIQQVEALLALVISPDHRLMIVNNVGKGGGAEKTLKYVLRLRSEQVADLDRVVTEFVRYLIPPPPERQPRQFDLLGQGNLFLARQQGNLAHLGQVHPNRIVDPPAFAFADDPLEFFVFLDGQLVFLDADGLGIGEVLFADLQRVAFVVNLHAQLVERHQQTVEARRGNRLVGQLVVDLFVGQKTIFLAGLNNDPNLGFDLIDGLARGRCDGVRNRFGGFAAALLVGGRGFSRFARFGRGLDFDCFHLMGPCNVHGCLLGGLGSGGGGFARIGLAGANGLGGGSGRFAGRPGRPGRGTRLVSLVSHSCPFAKRAITEA